MLQMESESLKPAGLIHLKNRGVISIEGNDAVAFLQGILTNDMLNVSHNKYLYAFMLTPQGRFLHDFFIVCDNNRLLLDCQAAHTDAIVARLNKYKLRSKVAITNVSADLLVYYSPTKTQDEPVCFEDPRTPALGYRLVASGITVESPFDVYEKLRMGCMVPDADADFIYDKTFPLDFGGLELNAIDLKKGCYVGQEVVSRMYYRGNRRKKLFLLEFTGSMPMKGEEFEVNGKKIGLFLGAVSNLVLALLNVEEVAGIGNGPHACGERMVTIV